MGSPVLFMIPKWNHKKTGTYIFLKIRIPGIHTSNNLGNLGYAYTLKELGCVHTLGELDCGHTLG